MKLIANHAFARRLFSALWLVLAVPAGHLAFACQLMNNASARPVCCCTKEIAGACNVGGHCDAHLAGKQRGCCVVSEQSAYAATTAANDDVNSITPQRPVLAIPVPLHLTLQTLQTNAVSRSLMPFARSEQSIYLTTGRLRI